MGLALFKGSGGGAFWRGNNASGDSVNVPAAVMMDPSTGNALSFGGAVTSGWDGSQIDASGFDECQVAVSGLSGGDSIAVKGSVTGANPVTLTGVKMADNTTLTSITADGLYSFPACGKIQYTKTGTASTPTVNLLRK